MPATYPDLLAHGIEDLGSFAPFNLYAGPGPGNTTQMQAADGQAIEQFAVLAVSGGKVVPYDPTATTPAQQAFGVAMQPVDAATPGAMLPIMYSGGFNHEALKWHASLDTLQERQAAFAGTPISVHQLL